MDLFISVRSWWMQQGGCCLSRDSPVAVQCLSRGVCCSVGTQPYVFSSCVLLCWPPKACWCQWSKGSSSSLQLCAALTECLSLISAMSSFCLWIQNSVWEEQCKRLREGLWLMPSSWPDSTATTETTGLVLMCAFIHSPCLTLWHR